MIKKFSCAMVIALAMVMAIGTLPARAGGQALDMPGDLLLGAIYDLRDASERDFGSWENFMVIQNTTNNWVAAHLRFRSYLKSIEVWDHIILLSPYDVFWVSLTPGAGGEGVNIYSADTHTLVNSGLIASPATEYSASFSTQLIVDCGFADDATETMAGEVEVIGMWQINNTSHDLSAVLKAAPFSQASADVNGDGNVNALDVLAAAWEDADNTGSNIAIMPAPTSAFHDAGNVLTGSMELGDIVTGQYMLYNLTAVQDFRTYGAFHRDGLATGAILYPDDLLFGRNYYGNGGVGVPAYYYNADWATTTGPTLRDGDAAFSDATGTAGDGGEWCTAAGIDTFNRAWSMIDLEQTLRVSALWGFYMEDAFKANIMTDAVLSFPTKYLHYLHYTGSDCSDPTTEWPFWDGSVGVGTYNDAVIKYRAAIKAGWDAIANGPVLLQTFDIWDTEQNKPNAISGPSPHPLFDIRIPHEVNVINVVAELFKPVFDASGEAAFDAGQFTLGGFTFNAQQRYYGDGGDDPFEADLGAEAVLGGTMRIHEMALSLFYRSTMAPWQVELYPDN